jgi:hypothetical protein
MTKSASKLACAAVLLAASAACAAHRFHAGMTDVAFNARTGSTEVVHTYMAHDIDALFENLYQRTPDLEQDEDEALLRRYVERQFHLENAAGARLPLHWVGIKAGVDTVVIYQEAAHTALPVAGKIHDQVLIDLIGDQVNTLNLTRDGIIRTFSFDRSKSEQTLAP